MIWSRILVDGRALCDGWYTLVMRSDRICDMIDDGLCEVRVTLQLVVPEPQRWIY